MTGDLIVRRLLELVPDLMTQSLLVADQVAALGLFTLDHNFNRITGLELGHAMHVENLFQGDEAFRLEPNVDNNMLVGDFDDGAGDDDLFNGQVRGGSGLGSLLAIKVRKGCSKISCIVVQIIVRFFGCSGSYSRNGAVVCRGGPVRERLHFDASWAISCGWVEVDSDDRAV